MLLFILGATVGGIVGVVSMSLCIAAKQGDRIK